MHLLYSTIQQFPPCDTANLPFICDSSVDFSQQTSEKYILITF